MSDRPETHYQLPQGFAAALGQIIASFGWLEEVLKRALYSLDRARLADDLSDADLGRWLRHMEDIADDSMGTLVEQLDAALRRAPGIADRVAINDRLTAIKARRNLLCHASWRPTQTHGRWHPAFVNTKGVAFPDDFSVEDLTELQAEVLSLGQRIIRLMRDTGIPSAWVGDD